MRLTLPQRFDFGADRALAGADLVDPVSWDRVRLETTGHFAMAADPGVLRDRAAASPDLVARAAAIAAVAGDDRVASYGVGAALLERRLLDEGVTVEVAEYAPATRERLQRLLPGVPVHAHDLSRDPPLDADLHLLHRVDTELDDHTWRTVYARFAGERLLVVPGATIAWRDVPMTVVHLWRIRRATRTGWSRTRAAQRALWRATHADTVLDLAGTEAFLLQPRRSRAVT